MIAAGRAGTTVGAAPGPSLAAMVAAGARRLAAAGVETPGADARCLAQAACAIDRTRLLTDGDRAVPAAEAAAFRRMVERRARREPVSRIRGRREFWSLAIGLDPAVLDPRPDSETLVAAALDRRADRRGSGRILDLGTGSGCLLFALLSERPDDQGIGVDISGAAVRQAAATAQALGLADRARFAVGAWGAGLADGAFDLVVANPPYIPTAEIAGLEPEVRTFDPPGALDGGADGLAAYRAIAADLPRLLAPGGIAVLEIGAAQAPAVTRLLGAAGFASVARHRDLAGRERCLVVEKAVGKMGGSG